MNNTEQNILKEIEELERQIDPKGILKKYNVRSIIDKATYLIMELQTRNDNEKAPFLDLILKSERREGYQLAKKDIINLFKGDHIYSGAVIKFEINNMK